MSNPPASAPVVDVASSIFEPGNAGAGELQVQAVDLTAQNTLGLPCHAVNLAVVSNLAQLPTVTALASQYSQVFVLGGGSNVVLPVRLASLVLKVELRGIALAHDSSDCRLIDVAAGED